MKLVVATESSTLMRWCRASLLASPTVLPASMVPWRWITPVRARIASSSVVLPLWNGPTSATQRGPVARVPPFALAAMTLSRGGEPSFQASAGLVKRRDSAASLARPFGCRQTGRVAPSGSPQGMQFQGADAGGDVEAELALH